MTAAKKLASIEPYLATGRVERVGETLRVALPTDRIEARRAKGCLVAPEVGDKVLCAVDPEGAYVLSVLEGAEGAPTRLTTEGDLQVQSRGGRVAIGGAAGVDIVSRGAVGVTAGEVHLRASTGSVAVEELGFFGKLLQAEVTKVALVAQEVDTRFTRLCQRAKRVFRFIEELDQTRAGTVDMRAQSMIGIRGENAIIAARVVAKVDGEQIHIG